jgi:hypothetical protein
MKKPEEMTEEEILRELEGSEKDPSEMSDEELEGELKALEGQEADQNPPGPLETFAREAFDTATMNYGPEILAATDIDPTKSYQEKLKGQVERGRKGEAENPIASLLGTGAGLVGPGGAGMAATKGATKAIKAAKSAPNAIKAAAPVISEILVNLGMNFGQNPGHDVTGDGGDLNARIDQATDPLAVAASVAGPVAGKVLEKTLDPIEQGVKALGFRKGDVRNMLQRSEGSTLSEGNVVNEAKRMKILKPMSSIEDIRDRASEKSREVGQKIRAIMTQNSEMMNEWYSSLPVQTRRMFDAAISGSTTGSLEGLAKVRNAIMDEMGPYGEVGATAAKRAMSVVEASSGGGKGDLEDLWNLKGRLQKLVYGENEAISKMGGSTLQKEAYEAAMRKVDEMIDTNIGILENGILSSVHATGVHATDKIKFRGLREQYEKLKKEYAVARSIEKSATDRMAADIASRQSVGLRWSDLGKLVIPSASTGSSMGTAVKRLNRAPLLTPAMIGSNQPQFLYGGYKDSQTQVIDPMQIPAAESELMMLDLPPSEKAKRLNLLRKYGRVYVGP